MTIEEMNLAPTVAVKARALQAAVPGVIFTSGRRTLAQQAHAMAANIAASGHRGWIIHTYATSIAVSRLQAWVDVHPGAVTVEALAAGLLSVFQRLSPIQQAGVSHHLTGHAFDIQPGTCPVAEIEKLNPHKVLTHEGGLARLHVEF